VSGLTAQQEQAAKGAIGALHEVTQVKMANLEQLQVLSARRQISNS